MNLLLEAWRAQRVAAKDIHSVVLTLTIILRTDSFFSTRFNTLGLQEIKYLTEILMPSAGLHGSFVLLCLWSSMIIMVAKEYRGLKLTYPEM